MSKEENEDASCRRSLLRWLGAAIGAVAAGCATGDVASGPAAMPSADIANGMSAITFHHTDGSCVVIDRSGMTRFDANGDVLVRCGVWA